MIVEFASKGSRKYSIPSQSNVEGVISPTCYVGPIDEVFLQKIYVILKKYNYNTRVFHTLHIPATLRILATNSMMT
jgi:hypothetical protein